jgi:tetratricopeptide (TPR) repeat protein
MEVGRSGADYLSPALCCLLLGISIAPAVLGQAAAEAQRHAESGFALASRNELKSAETELRRAVELAPENSEYLSGLGSILGIERKLQESTFYLEKALELDPENLAARRNLASNQLQMGRPQEAQKNLQLILKSKPGDPRTILLLGMVADGVKDFKNAVQLLESVPQLVQQQPEAIFVLADAYYGTGAKEKARQTLESLVTHPAGPRGVFLGAQAAASAKDFETAEKLFRSIHSTYPHPDAVGYNLALVQYRTGRIDESQKSLLDLIAAGYQTVDIYNLLALCYHRQGKSAEAVRVFEQAAARIPKKESDHLQLGQALLKSKLLPAAHRIAEKAIEIDPSSDAAYKLKGEAELEMHFYTDAIRSYSRALELNTNSEDADLGLARAQWGAGMIPEAVATFERGITRFPRHTPHYTEYARMLLKLVESGERDREAELRALSLLNTAVALDGSQSDAHYEMGSLLLARGKVPEALKELQIAARLDPERSKIRYSLARAYRRLGRTEEAESEMQDYYKLKAEEDAQL